MKNKFYLPIRLTTLSVCLISAMSLDGCSSNSNEVNLSTGIQPLACKKAPAPGPCRAAVKHFYYDKSLNACQSFTWGGCKGQVPFKTLKMCKRSCERI